MRHVSRSIQIEAPVDRVLALAGDRGRWAEWFVGLGQGNGRPGSGQGGNGFAVGVPFPLAQPSTEEALDGLGTQWRSRSEGRGEVARCEGQTLLMMGCDQVWTYVRKSRGTELTVELDYTLPAGADAGAQDSVPITEAVAQCVEQSLVRLKALSETSV
jgi:hypothetical protein